MTTNVPSLAFFDPVGTPEIVVILALLLGLIIVPKLMELYENYRNSR